MDDWYCAIPQAKFDMRFLLSRTLGRELHLGLIFFKIVSGALLVHLLHLLAPLALVYHRDTRASCLCFCSCVLSLMDPPQ